MLILLLAAWMLVHTLVYLFCMQKMCIFTVTRLCNAPSLEGLEARGYSGARLALATEERLANVLAIVPNSKLVYYGTKLLYFAIGALGFWAIAAIL